MDAESRLLIAEGQVTTPFEGGAWVEFTPLAGCQGCAASQGCGTGLWARWRGARPRHLAIDSHRPLHPGERVAVALPARGLVQGALGLYGMPLIGALGLGAWGEARFGADNPAVILALLTGLALGAGLTRLVARYHGARYRPRLHEPPGR